MVSDADLAFRWYGGRPSLNFTATLGKRHTRGIERLREPADLARWFREGGLADGLVDASPDDLTRACELREALYGLFTGTGAGLDVVNHWAARPAVGGRLELVDGKLTLAPPNADLRGLLTLLARDGVDLLTGPLAGRIRMCGDDDCTLLFVDESRAGARRWCSMDTCGARAKMARYRAPRT
jgi:predicted RNA-binding Zn ribbon-like protein